MTDSNGCLTVEQTSKMLDMIKVHPFVKTIF